MLGHASHPKLVTDLILCVLDNYVLIIMLYFLSRFSYYTQSQTNKMVNANRWVWHSAFQQPGKGMQFFISQLAVDNEQFQYITIKSVRAILAQGVSANCTLRNTSITVRKKLLQNSNPCQYVERTLVKSSEENIAQRCHLVTAFWLWKALLC